MSPSYTDNGHLYCAVDLPLPMPADGLARGCTGSLPPGVYAPTDLSATPFDLYLTVRTKLGQSTL
jgi:hypothetical protein